MEHKEHYFTIDICNVMVDWAKWRCAIFTITLDE